MNVKQIFTEFLEKKGEPIEDCLSSMETYSIPYGELDPMINHLLLEGYDYDVSSISGKDQSTSYSIIEYEGNPLFLVCMVSNESYRKYEIYDCNNYYNEIATHKIYNYIKDNIFKTISLIMKDDDVTSLNEIANQANDWI